MDENNKEEQSLSLEIFKEIKLQSKRCMIALLVVIAMWAATIGGFIWYLYQYDFASYTQDGSGYNNINTGTQGDVNNGTEIPNTQEEER